VPTPSPQGQDTISNSNFSKELSGSSNEGASNASGILEADSKFSRSYALAHTQAVMVAGQFHQSRHLLSTH
jgi:hypothetical protein